MQENLPGNFVEAMKANPKANARSYYVKQAANGAVCLVTKLKCGNSNPLLLEEPQARLLFAHKGGRCISVTQ